MISINYISVGNNIGGMPTTVVAPHPQVRRRPEGGREGVQEVRK
jgi:hypothetical protein